MVDTWRVIWGAMLPEVDILPGDSGEGFARGGVTQAGRNGFLSHCGPLRTNRVLLDPTTVSGSESGSPTNFTPQHGLLASSLSCFTTTTYIKSGRLDLNQRPLGPEH
jgi:hypothetical protein